MRISFTLFAAAAMALAAAIAAGAQTPDVADWRAPEDNGLAFTLPADAFVTEEGTDDGVS